MSSVSTFGVQSRQLKPSERWICFAALFFLGFTATFNQFKAAPAIQYIGADLGMSVDMLSQIMGVFSIAGMLLAFPGMLVMQRFGVKFSIVVTSIIQLIGSLICAFSGDTAIFLVGRTLEGVAYGLICVIGPNIMPRLFPLKDQGVVMGIWSQWTPMGVVIAFFTAPMIYEAAGGAAIAFSWQPIWYVSIAMEIISIVWLLVSCKMPAISENELVDGDPARRKRPGKNFMLAGFMVCACFFVWVFVYVANINTLYPTFLQNMKGLSVFDSSMLPNWTAIITIPLGIVFGIVADKFNFRKWMVAGGYLIVAVCVLLLLHRRRRHDRPLDRLHPYGHCRSPCPDGHPRNRAGLGPRAEKDRPRARHHGVRDRRCPGRWRLHRLADRHFHWLPGECPVRANSACPSCSGSGDRVREIRPQNP